MKIYIRNMACESCKVVVREALEKLRLHPIKVDLGEVVIKENIKGETKNKLNSEIKKAGLEIAESKGGILIEKIRKVIIESVYNSDKPDILNFSHYLSKKLNYEYNYLSTIFSEVEATTISHYIIKLKVERAKELILFENLSLSEIAARLHYKNLSHFSLQFKKETGFSPSHFKQLKEKRRIVLQKLSEQAVK